jgi:hypothetical protein
MSIEDKLKDLRKKVKGGKASQLEKIVYKKCRKVLKFCKKFGVPLELATTGVVGLHMMHLGDHPFLKEFEAAGYRREEISPGTYRIRSPVELYLLRDIESPLVEVASKIYKDVKPKIMDRTYWIDDYGPHDPVLPPVKHVRVEVRFEKPNERGVLVFDANEFVVLEILIGKSFLMTKRESPEDFIRKLEEYRKSLGLR